MSEPGVQRDDNDGAGWAERRRCENGGQRKRVREKEK